MGSCSQPFLLFRRRDRVDESQYVDIITEEGDWLRIVYEITVGDLLIAAVVSLLVLVLVLNAVLKILWR